MPELAVNDLYACIGGVWSHRVDYDILKSPENTPQEVMDELLGLRQTAEDHAEEPMTDLSRGWIQTAIGHHLFKAIVRKRHLSNLSYVDVRMGRDSNRL